VTLTRQRAVALLTSPPPAPLDSRLVEEVVTTDADVEIGAGPEVRGTTLALLLAAAV
jgi:hypothetical protein